MSVCNQEICTTLVNSFLVVFEFKTAVKSILAIFHVDFQEDSDDWLNLFFVCEQVSRSQQMQILHPQMFVLQSYSLACYFLEGYHRQEACVRGSLQKPGNIP